MESGTYYSDRFTIGDRVEWRREVYRMPYAKRPIDTGEVVEIQPGFLRVRRDGDGSLVLGPAVVFSKVKEDATA